MKTEKTGLQEYKYPPLILLVIVAGTFIGWMYRQVWQAPDSYLFGNTGDAVKNYFTYTGQAASGTGFQSDLMNYPYGENLLYLDCVPALSRMIHKLNIYFPDVSDHSVGILHVLMLSSLFLSALFLYLIFRELKLNALWAVAGAFGIMMMSPQIFRMTGHLALSFAVFIPLTWYLTIRFFRSRRPVVWIVLQGINILFWFFVHGYLGMIAASFTLLQFIAGFFTDGSSGRDRMKKWLYPGIAVLLPMVVFWTVISITDQHIGRTTNPWGFFSNNANPTTIFLPHHGWLRKALGQVFTFKSQNWGGWAYIGLSSTVVTILLLIGWIRRRRAPSSVPVSLWNQVMSEAILKRSLLAGVILLLFSMSIPFNLGLQFLLEWFPVIKKFRALGRFAWVFYYVMTVTGVYSLHAVYHSGSEIKWSPWIKKGLSVVLLFLFVAEGWPYHTEMASQYNRYPNNFSPAHLTAEFSQGLEKTVSGNYQAILPLPFYHKGSENFAIEGTDRTYRASMTVASHTGLPILGNYSTHTSIPEAKNSLQILAPNFYEKAIQKDFPSSADLLIVYSKEALNAYETAVLAKARKIYTGAEFELYALPLAALFDDAASSEIREFTELLQKDVLIRDGEFYLSGPGQWWYEGFEESESSYRIEGSGAYRGNLSDRKTLWSLPAGVLSPDKKYHLSFWFSHFGPNFGQDITNVKVRVNEVSPEGEKETIVEVRPAYSMVIDGDWSLVELEFTPRNPAHSVEVFLYGPWKQKGEYNIDELILKEKSLRIYKILKSTDGMVTGLMKNNHRIFYELNRKE